jgi:hypothetical protein
MRAQVLYPRVLLTPASIGAVAFETLAPAMLLLPAQLISVPFAVFGLTFHYGIALLQNIDFLSWWGPAYAFLLADPAAWYAKGGSSLVDLYHADFYNATLGSTAASCAGDVDYPLSLRGSVAAAYEYAPLRASLALAYVAVHLAAVVVMVRAIR